MSKRIEVGDRVLICMTSTVPFGWISCWATVEYIPCSTGDNFIFALDNGDTIDLNPQCGEFAGLIKSDIKEDN